MAELVYAVDLKSTVREELGVRIPSPAPKYAVQVSVTSIEKVINVSLSYTPPLCFNFCADTDYSHISKNTLLTHSKMCVIIFYTDKFEGGKIW